MLHMAMYLLKNQNVTSGRASLVSGRLACQADMP
jgi:hypothetical protein